MENWRYYHNNNYICIKQDNEYHVMTPWSDSDFMSELGKSIQTSYLGITFCNLNSDFLKF